MGHVLVSFRAQVVHDVLEASHRQCILHQELIGAVCRRHGVGVRFIKLTVYIFVGIARWAGLTPNPAA
jgi:hypothetical protein